jgi:hypothetical protein
MASMNGVNKHMGGMNKAKPVVTPKGANPTQFARNNLAKGGVNNKMADKGKKSC